MTARYLEISKMWAVIDRPYKSASRHSSDQRLNFFEHAAYMGSCSSKKPVTPFACLSGVLGSQSLPRCRWRSGLVETVRCSAFTTQSSSDRCRYSMQTHLSL